MGVREDGYVVKVEGTDISVDFLGETELVFEPADAFELANKILDALSAIHKRNRYTKANIG